MAAAHDTAASAIGQDEFASLIEAVGPFEDAPRLAVACSGGADSMALTLLLRWWCDAGGGTVTALTVDHRLRAGSTDEARQVAGWLGERGIDHVILTRPDTPIAGNLQAAAREVRYALLSDWCVRNEVLHLFLAHHREDQAETVLLRLARGSGVDGLAGMPPVAETADVRLLRPLLPMPRERLQATLRSARQPHVEDPSNSDTAFARVRLRQAASILDREGLSASRLAATAGRMALARTALEGQCARLLAESVTFDARGYAEIVIDAFRAAETDTALRALARVVSTVSGNPYPPRYDRVARLWSVLSDPDSVPRGRTLGGCRLVPKRGLWLVCREARAADEELSCDRKRLFWDGRFRIRLAEPSLCTVRRLGAAGWKAVSEVRPEVRPCGVPAPVRPTLPSFWYLDDLVSVPHLNYVRDGGSAAPPTVEEVTFAPRKPLTGAGFISGQSVSESLTLGDAL